MVLTDEIILGWYKEMTASILDELEKNGGLTQKGKKIKKDLLNFTKKW